MQTIFSLSILYVKHKYFTWILLSRIQQNTRYTELFLPPILKIKQKMLFTDAKRKKLILDTIICQVDTYGEKLTIVRTVTQTTSNYKIKERVDSKDSSLEKVDCILGNFLFNEKTRAQKMGDNPSCPKQFTGGLFH